MSTTAESVCALGAVAAKYHVPKVRKPDYLAERFVSTEFRRASPLSHGALEVYAPTQVAEELPRAREGLGDPARLGLRRSPAPAGTRPRRLSRVRNPGQLRCTHRGIPQRSSRG